MKVRRSISMAVTLSFLMFFYLISTTGDFIDDNKEGTGTIYLSNGDRFTGSFNNDFVHGQGTYFRE